MDGVVDYLPSPPWRCRRWRAATLTAGRPNAAGPTVKAPFSGLAYKVQMDQGRKLVYVRIYSGTLKAGDEVFNAGKGFSEKVARLSAHARQQARAPEPGPRPGEIVGRDGA